VGELHVTVRYHGEVVEDCVLSVRGEVRLGEAPHSQVVFPGADLKVFRVGSDLQLGKRRLRPGERTGFSRGPVHVQVEHVERLTWPRARRRHVDLRFLLIAMAVAASGMWLDTLTAVVEHPAGGAFAERYEQVRARLSLPGLSDRDDRQRSASVQPGSEFYLLLPDRESLIDGPPAHPDDSVTGWAYYPWYRQVVPGHTSPRARLGVHTDDEDLHLLAAVDAYQNEKWEVAHHHYQWLVKDDPRDTEWRMGLASARKRLGMHRAELETYDRILLEEPEHFLALGNRAVAYARLDRWSDVPGALARMHRASPDNPYGQVFEALCASLQGREDEAIAHLEEAISRRGAMSDDLQIELRRDLALDPALAPLRADPRLRAMLSRQLGAASPRPRH
jgi:tetratricopeptide (TPR) repeat protein